MKAPVLSLGRRIAELRRAKRMTQERLAERANVNVKTIQGVEQGRTEPETRTLRRLAVALGSSLDALTGHADRARQSTPEALRRQIVADLRSFDRDLLEPLASVVRQIAMRAALRRSR